MQDIYNIFQAIPAEDTPIFLALDLNNLLCIDVKNARKNLMEKMVEEQDDMKRQLTDLKNIMARTNTSTSTSGNQAYADAVRAAQTTTAGRMPPKRARNMATCSSNSTRQGMIQGENSSASMARQSSSREAVTEPITIASSVETPQPPIAEQEDNQGFITQSRNRRRRTAIVGTTNGED